MTTEVLSQKSTISSPAPSSRVWLYRTLLAAAVTTSTPMLDPKTLTALCLLLLGIGVYYASRKRI